MLLPSVASPPPGSTAESPCNAMGEVKKQARGVVRAAEIRTAESPSAPRARDNIAWSIRSGRSPMGTAPRADASGSAGAPPSGPAARGCRCCPSTQCSKTSPSPSPSSSLASSPGCSVISTSKSCPRRLPSADPKLDADARLRLRPRCLLPPGPALEATASEVAGNGCAVGGAEARVGAAPAEMRSPVRSIQPLKNKTRAQASTRQAAEHNVREAYCFNIKEYTPRSFGGARCPPFRSRKTELEG